MHEYHIFLHDADDPAWTPKSTFVIHAPNDDVIRDIFPKANRIYRFDPQFGLNRIA